MSMRNLRRTSGAVNWDAVGNTFATHGVGAVAVTLAVTYVFSVLASVSFGMLLIGLTTLGVIVLSAALSSSTDSPTAGATIAILPSDLGPNSRSSSIGRLQAFFFGLTLIVAASGALVAVA